MLVPFTKPYLTTTIALLLQKPPGLLPKPHAGEGKALATLASKNPHLKKLDISNTRLKASGLQALAESWPEKGELEELNVAGNIELLEDAENRSMGY